MGFYAITKNNEAKLHYATAKNGELIIYDRDSTSGLSVLDPKEVRILNESDDHTKYLFLEFDKNLPPEFRYTAVSLWNGELDETREVPEFRTYLNNLANEGDAFAIYFRELLFQESMCKFDENFLSTYKGQYANSDKTVHRGAII